MFETIKVYKNDELVNEVTRKVSVEKMPTAIDDMFREQNETDFLGIGVKDAGLGSRLSWFDNSEGLSTFLSEDDSSNTKHDGPNSFIMGGRFEENPPLKIVIKNEDGTETETEYSFHLALAREGLVLYTGVSEAGGFFGKKSKRYLYKVTAGQRYRMTTSIKNAAKIFKNEAALLTYLKKYETPLSLFAGNNGYDYQVEYASKVEEKQHKKSNKAEELQNLLDKINNSACPCAEFKWPEVSEELTEENIKKEAKARLSFLKVMPEVIKGYEEGQLLFSDVAGILYNVDSDEDCKKALEDVKEKGVTPYHLIKSYTNMGTMVTVLGVSKYLEDWEYERPTKKYAAAYVYNASDPVLSEFGDVVLSSCNGGLVREF